MTVTFCSEALLRVLTVGNLLMVKQDEGATIAHTTSILVNLQKFVVSEQCDFDKRCQNSWSLALAKHI